MKLEGSCHCQAVKFTVESDNYYPYQRCYCSICRKTQGGGGYAINLSAKAKTLKVKGKENISVYRAKIKNPEDKRIRQSTGERNFCKICSSGLWLFSPEWPELLHPFASVIDTPLPIPPRNTHLMLDFKAPWIKLQIEENDKKFKRYPVESIAHWHEKYIYELSTEKKHRKKPS